jgi:hypothetical protein
MSVRGAFIKLQRTNGDVQSSTGDGVQVHAFKAQMTNDMNIQATMPTQDERYTKNKRYQWQQQLPSHARRRPHL